MDQFSQDWDQKEKNTSYSPSYKLNLLNHKNTSGTH